MPKRKFIKMLPVILLIGILLSACQSAPSDSTRRPGTFSAVLPEGSLSFFVDLSGVEIPYIKVQAVCDSQNIDRTIAGVNTNFKIDEDGKFAFKTSEGYTFTGEFSRDSLSASGTYDLAGYCSGKWQAAQTSQAPAVVATVNGTPISGVEFVQRARYKRYVLVSQYNRLKDLYAVVSQQNNAETSQTMQQQMADIAEMLNSPQEIGQQTLDDLIQEALIRQEAERRGITVSDAEIQDEINHTFQYYPEGAPTPAAGKTPEPTPVSIQKDVFDKKYQTMLTEVKANTNQSEAEIRNFFKTQIITRKLVDVLFPQISQGDEQVHISQILVANNDTAQTVLRMLGSGQSWEKLVSTYSQDPTALENKGDIGWFGIGQLPAALEEAAFSTPVGQVTAPLQSDYGWHLLKIIEKEYKPFTAERLATVRNQLMASWTTQQRSSGVEITSGWEQLIPYIPALPSGR